MSPIHDTEYTLARTHTKFGFNHLPAACYSEYGVAVIVRFQGDRVGVEGRLDHLPPVVLVDKGQAHLDTGSNRVEKIMAAPTKERRREKGLIGRVLSFLHTVVQPGLLHNDNSAKAISVNFIIIITFSFGGD